MPDTSLLIVGSGGHAKVALDCARSMNRFARVSFVTNDVNCSDEIDGCVVYHESELDRESFYDLFDCVFIAVGDNSARKSLSELYKSYGCKLTTLTHPSACISANATIGEGSIVMPFAAINAFAYVGDGCIVNTGAIVEHDCVIGDYVHLSPGAKLGGGTTVGSLSWLCIGSTAIDHISIGPNTILGANSCAIENLLEKGTYVGSPAHLVSRD